MTLADYLDRAARRPFKPGEHDCALFLAGWILLRTGVDVAEGMRGYGLLRSTRVIRTCGGLVPFFRGRAVLAGLLDTARPKIGDVGVVEAQGVPLGAICSGATVAGLRWAAIGSHGLLSAVVAPLAAWGVP